LKLGGVTGNGVTGPGAGASGAGFASSGAIVWKLAGAGMATSGIGTGAICWGIGLALGRWGSGLGGWTGFSTSGVLIRLTMIGAALRIALRTGA
jgi:hypothetical protein